MCHASQKGRSGIKRITYEPPRLTIAPKPHVGEPGGDPIPTKEQIEAHCKRYGYEDVDVDEFIAYYEKVGWSHLRNWKTSLNMWNMERKHAPIGKVVSMAEYLKRSMRSSKSPNGIGSDRN